MGHFGVLKTLSLLQEHFYWPNMRRDVERICERCLKWRKKKINIEAVWIVQGFADSYLSLGRFVYGFYSWFA